MSLYWHRLRGYVSENKVDARWLLRDTDDKKVHGSLRIVSHPDLPPGYLRSYFCRVVGSTPRTREEILLAIDEYCIDERELEVYSLDEKIETTMEQLVESKQELEKIFNVKVFD